MSHLSSVGEAGSCRGKLAWGHSSLIGQILVADWNRGLGQLSCGACLWRHASRCGLLTLLDRGTGFIRPEQALAGHDGHVAHGFRWGRVTGCICGDRVSGGRGLMVRVMMNGMRCGRG